MESREKAKLAVQALEDKKGIDITVIDISEVSVMADYFVIASGGSPNQVQALIDNVDETLGRAGENCKAVEGHRESSWILMDFGDVIIHIFDRENRLFYDLERIWKDGKQISKEDL
ncbi:MAG: ribosome silencing factor [Lachnospiraceae bacterium]|nr:ribosome silencing factor [Lachnospiraceae bacterium]